MNHWIWITMLTLLPISELRGGLPYALLEGEIRWIIAYPYCVLINALVGPIAYAFLDTVHRLLYRWKFYARMFDVLVERARGKISRKVERWGFWGVVIFVGIPLPITGAWTGILGAWTLGLSRRRSIIAVLLGVILSGLIVSVVVLAGVQTLDVFIDKG